MGLRKLLKKKDEVAQDREAAAAAAGGPSSAEFTFLRTDTTTQEVIHPPAGAESGTGTGGAAGGNESLLSPNSPVRSPPRRSLDVFRPARSRSGSTSSQASHSSPSKKRLSERLHLSRPPEASDFVPQDLPEIAASADPNDDESQWEHRATILAGQGLAQGAAGLSEARASLSSSRPTSPSPTPVSSQTIDSNVQEAIRLHEQGDYEQSTKIFGRLADPQGANNPLSQVLYGLALR